MAITNLPMYVLGAMQSVQFALVGIIVLNAVMGIIWWAMSVWVYVLIVIMAMI